MPATGKWRHCPRSSAAAPAASDGRQSRGIERAKITHEIARDLGHWGVEIVGKVKAWAKAISGPTSSAGKYPQLMNAPRSETGPGPQLGKAMMGADTTLLVT